MSPNDIASRFFTSWYTIYERVSSCQATSVDATTLTVDVTRNSKSVCGLKAMGIGSRLIFEGFQSLLGRFVKSDPAPPRGKLFTQA
jgi:hypothetical protein